MKILAVFGSRFGQAEAVLRRVVGTLEAEGHTVRVVTGDAVPLGLRVEDYDGVVIAASVILGHHQAYIRRFIRKHIAALTNRPTAFLSVNGASPASSAEWRADAQRYVTRLLADTSWKPRWIESFAGALRYTRYDIVTRWIMKMISRHRGGPTDTSRDYEFTDWNAVDAFAARLVEELGREAGTEEPPRLEPRLAS